MKKHFLAAATIACLALTGVAQAQVVSTTVVMNDDSSNTLTQPGFVDSTAWLRAGPDPEYPVVATITSGQDLDIYGCVDNYEWCDVQADNVRGWISGQYLLLPQYNAPIVEYGPRIVALPIVIFNRDAYWDRYYRGRPFYNRWYAAHPHRPVVIHTAPRPVVIHNNYQRPVIRNNIVVRPNVQPRPVVVHEQIHPTEQHIVAPGAIRANVVAQPHAAAVIHQEERHDAPRAEHHEASHDNGGDRGGDHHDNH